MQATVYKSTGSWYIVKADNGEILNARIKGVFKIDGITSTNPIAVGDKVAIEADTESERSVVIVKIIPRKNYIARASPHNKNQHHIVASNLDQALLFATLKNPRTSPGFIDRFLVTAEAYHVPAVIIFNKTDLHKNKEEEKFAELKRIYSDIGYKVAGISLVNNQGLDEVKDLLHNKTTLISGHSGVGKSTFINSILPEKNLKTREVSGWSGKGMHTTTFAEMFDLAEGGAIIDTPGIREFALADMPKAELSHYFPEMRAVLPECKFNNCLHVNEPDCAVKNAVMHTGRVSPGRYISYINILDTL
ncbi:ribosome small subunit-dependent GTPase A [Haoranjiania flava]|uniref:Small ribosomal subunit biogenesis GTPase RsgA n=1 Tax=Haoranjiania flava TaxID=1856322 RepID=A0AAE3INN7_9BACT|nr:ribosome small subunit-dependent GTPase A [Haoranjiania flava]MCU7695244.1 ribosome small subunit-dependent GTPase A [Haoranjiania flava]